MNGLRSAPLFWYRELSSFLSGQGFAQILDPTIFRRKGKRGLIVVLFYVDDLLIWAEDNRDALSTYEDLRNRYKLATIFTLVWILDTCGHVGMSFPFRSL